MTDDKVREIVDLYFAPWGAGKAARWERLSGDRDFSAEAAMTLIRAAIEEQTYGLYIKGYLHDQTVKAMEQTDD